MMDNILYICLVQAVDAYMLEYQRRLRDQLEKMEELKKTLSPAPNNKVSEKVYHVKNFSPTKCYNNAIIV